MQSRWNDAEARALAAQAGSLPELGRRVYTSRLLGREPSLVLHGGGNTSVKLGDPGRPGDDVLFVKGSGSDLASVQASDFAAVRLSEVRRLIECDDLDNDALAAAVAHSVTRPGPKPSIETLLHAVLPRRFVEHTHADSILAITNTVQGEALAHDLFGDLAPPVPFRQSGFALARAAHEVYRRCATARTIGLVLLHHGVFAFGDGARESYENMVQLVSMAEAYLVQHGAWELPEDPRPFAPVDPLQIAQLRSDLSHLAGFPLLLHRLDGPRWHAYARRADLAAIASQGPATPQHAVFIKREPLLDLDLDGYAERYRQYVAAAYPGRDPEELGLDPAPRAIVDPNLGVWAAGISAHHLAMTIDILRQDMEIKSRAAGHDRYRGLPAEAILEAEIHYGGFEHRLHAAGGPETDFLGEVVLLCVSAADSAVLRTAFEAHGAVVADPDVLEAAEHPDAVASRLALRVGGLDVIVTDSQPPAWLENLIPLLAHAPRGGRVVVLHGGAASAGADFAPARVSSIQHRRRKGAALSEREAQRVLAACAPRQAPR